MITKLEDYLDDLQARFPSISRTQLRRICTYGFKMFYLYTKWGADIYVRSPDIVLYSGKIMPEGLRAKYKLIKSSIKARLQYKQRKTIWDGYYYMGFTEELYKEYADKIKRKRKKDTPIIFKNMYIFKVLEEAKLFPSFRYIIRIKWPLDCGFRHRPEKIKARNTELYLRRNPVNNQWEPVNYKSKNKQTWHKKRR